ncbi:hypothetical protein SDC9_100904 [bioreactor metagenome]|uniref:Uncharacterized protein n=1 Tax=bioreactor metagenome TaxID=1076179 RepID=A0A645AP98_9ZZZZ
MVEDQKAFVHVFRDGGKLHAPPIQLLHLAADLTPLLLDAHKKRNDFLINHIVFRMVEIQRVDGPDNPPCYQRGNAGAKQEYPGCDKRHKPKQPAIGCDGAIHKACHAQYGPIRQADGIVIGLLLQGV